jgi:pyruvate,water dikinase
VWGTLIILFICPVLGGLPLIRWIVYGLTRQDLRRVGTGNVSVSAAFYHGGRLAGILAIASEAFKGIAAVLLARYFFPGQPVWEIVALMALVMGRYWFGKGAGTTNVVWGIVAHDPVSAGLIFLISLISFTILRERKSGRLAVLVLLPVITALRHPADGLLVWATVTLSVLLGWIYQKIPDDLDLSSREAQRGSQQMFKFFRGDRALLSLDQPLKVEKVGAKAATLSYLKRKGYPVPDGWALPPGDDPAPLIERVSPTGDSPVVVRSSAIGEDSETASAAGQYESILDVTSPVALEQAILRCQASYNLPGAVQYRHDRQLREQGMTVLVQTQVQGVFSGVAFSRDPVSRQGEAVVIEALPGGASRVVSGRVTPEQYRVLVRPEEMGETWVLPEAVKLPMEGEGDVPPRLIQQVAYLARHLEGLYYGVPQDVEWTFDGQQLWLLQSRPITTMFPIWTRKIAAEVIPGFIRPLTWSVNRPLTCGVWGEIFTVVLGDRARGLDFNETATLHNSAAYFNATLLGEIFLRMGLPPESLEFLTRGARFSKPPLTSTLRNVPGLLRLVRREMRLEQDFERDWRQWFQPGLAELAQQPMAELDARGASPLPQGSLLSRIDQILALLRRATYYSILAPLSLAVRQGIAKVPEAELDNGTSPEVASVRSLQSLAVAAREVIAVSEAAPQEVFTQLASSPDGQKILQRFDQFLQEFGYLSDVGTDIAVPTWREEPESVRSLFTQFVLNPSTPSVRRSPSQKAQKLQRRLDLKGRVTTVYSQLLAELRWSFVALEQRWLETGVLGQPGDIFFLEFEEIRQWVEGTTPKLPERVKNLVERRRSQYETDQQQTPVPILVYGNDPPLLNAPAFFTGESSSRQLRGIGASPGQVEGQILVLKTLQNVPAIDRSTILVVPFTDSGWAPLLAQAGGIIAEVGGRLSHGAIIAREYGIPAVMDVHNAMQQLSNGQWVRLDGQSGVVELL